MGAQFGVLGPLQVWSDGVEIGLPAGKHRALLAALLLRANRLVPVSDLIIQIWGDDPPGSARATTQTYVGRLRRVLGEGLIWTRPDGYLIEVSEQQLDLAEWPTSSNAPGSSPPVGTSIRLRSRLLFLSCR